MAKINLYGLGAGGVNLVKNPLQLADDELTQAQNAELNPDANIGGEGALSKRGGLAVLTGSALGGSVLGMVGVSLLTTYVRTLYAALGTADSNTFKTSTNGTTWTDSASALAPADLDKFSDAAGERDARRHAAIKNFIVYPGNGYTKGTDKPTIVLWDGTNALTVITIPFGPTATAETPAFAIVDWLTTEGKLYLAVHDPGGSAPNLTGRVLSLDLTTGALKQIANAFSSADVTGGYPAALAWYQDQLWVGLNGSSTTDVIGKIVRCYPDVATTWTTDVSNLRSHISSLGVFKGDLYAATRSSVSAGATLSRRASTGTTWATVATSGGGAEGNGFYGSLFVYSDELYAVEYFATTPIIHIIKSGDGTTWATDRDVDSVDGGVAGNLPSGVAELSGALHYVFRATTATATDGFILRKVSGVWTKVTTDNYGGPIVVLVTRS